MDIEINQPISIKLDVIEIDKRLPSMKFNVMILLKKFTYSLAINTQIWIDCECFDTFIENMKNENVANLKDMSGYFEIILKPSLNTLEWSHAKEEIDGSFSILKGREDLNSDSYAKIYESFNQYPKWW